MKYRTKVQAIRRLEDFILYEHELELLGAATTKNIYQLEIFPALCPLTTIVKTFVGTHFEDIEYESYKHGGKQCL
jgi:hypothetical protein